MSQFRPHPSGVSPITMASPARKAVRLLLAAGLLVCVIGPLADAPVAGAKGSNGIDRNDAGAEAFYVSPTGSDNNPGTRSRPFRTIAHAEAVVRAAVGQMRQDITVNLFGGTYRLTQPLKFGPEDSGTGGHNVIYQAVPGQTPIISGGTRITGWTLHDASKNIWEAHVPQGLDTRQLYVNGVRATRAQGQPPVTLTPSPGGYTASSPVMSTWPDADQLEFVYERGLGNWTEPRCPVASIVGTKITMQQPCWDNTTDRNTGAEPSMSPNTLPTYIDNAYELLDQPGEWFLDRNSSTIYYIPRPGENLATATVIAPVLQTLVAGDGTLAQPVHNIEFRGITFAYATWLEPSSANGFSDYQADTFITGPNAGQTEGVCSFGGACPFAAMSIPLANVSFRAAHDIVFSRDIFAHLGGSGLGFQFGSQDNTVIGNQFTDISANGVQIGNDTDPLPSDVGADAREINADNTVKDNYIHNIAVEYQGGIGIWEGYTQNSNLSHNQIDDVPYSGISSGWGWGQDSSTQINVAQHNEIENNLIFNYLQVLGDGGGIYVNGVQGSSAADGTQIIGNVVHDEGGNSDSLGIGLYDDWSDGVTLEHNVVYDNALADWGGCAGTEVDGTPTPLGNFVFSDNWWQGTESFGCEPFNLPVTIEGNTLIAGPQDVPQQVLDSAGLQPAFRGLLSEHVPY